VQVFNPRDVAAPHDTRRTESVDHGVQMRPQISERISQLGQCRYAAALDSYVAEFRQIEQISYPVKWFRALFHPRRLRQAQMIDDEPQIRVLAGDSVDCRQVSRWIDHRRQIERLGSGEEPPIGSGFELASRLGVHDCQTDAQDTRLGAKRRKLIFDRWRLRIHAGDHREAVGPVARSGESDPAVVPVYAR
jgi:hypothetical protein